jgi:hypothetical protein
MTGVTRSPKPEPAGWKVAITVGIAQTIAWGTLYYSIAALNGPMARAASVDEPTLYGAFTASLLIAGVLAPWAGRTVDRRGGALVLSASALAGAAGMAVLAASGSVAGLFVGWCLNGVAMAMGLYDVAFAAVYRSRRTDARRVLTGVTLLAGLASTIFWPLSHYLAQGVGLRTTLAAFGALMLATIPLYRWSFAGRGAVAVERTVEAAQSSRVSSQRTVLLLSVVFASTAFASGALSAHLLGTFATLGVPSAQIPWIASLVGVMQVVGRVLELAVGSRLSPLTTGLISLATLAGSFLVLLLIGASPALAWVFAATYGMSNGVLTIARATVPAALLGSENIGSLLGRLARPSVVTRAIAPWAFAATTEVAGAIAGTALLLVASLAAVGFYAALLPRHASRQSPAHPRASAQSAGSMP